MRAALTLQIIAGQALIPSYCEAYAFVQQYGVIALDGEGKLVDF
jgi:hypothetical protein